MDATYSRHLNLTDCEGKRIGACPDKVYFTYGKYKKVFDTIKTCDNCIQATIYRKLTLKKRFDISIYAKIRRFPERVCASGMMDISLPLADQGKISMRSALRESLGQRKDTLARSWV